MVDYKNDMSDLNMVTYLGDKKSMAKVSAVFDERSNGVLTRTIGALDGWLVCIILHSIWRDFISNPISFFNCEGFFALMLIV